jgi:hypothetical protein
MNRFISSALLLICATLGNAEEHTVIKYLSGHGADDTVKWQFRCSGGQNSGVWDSIAVPSCWEQQGFGDYTYGRFYLDKTAKPSSETGEYRHSFSVPTSWKGNTVELVFEGVMTDANVKINGKSAGAKHQGGFTAFSYDISPLLRYGKENQLEVFVEKESSNQSVNAAERRADWWLFGGIYRPVYLRVLPKTHIEHVGIDAKHDGTLNLRLSAKNLPHKATIEAKIDGKDPQSHPLTQSSLQNITFKWDGISSWDPEHPNMHNLTLSIIDKNGNRLHTHTEKVGFRTLEFIPRDGFYINGTRLVLKGVNRHCFYPETGRTTSRQLDLQDVKLVKGMNGNAIRSHYPPDRHLLELCDSLGVLYFDELAGWHDAYDTEVGTKILTEMLTHDANHPCIFAWGNGNEGGNNYELLPLFEQLDPQNRLVAHPWALFNGIDTHHYPAYQTGVARLANGYQVFMPTEFLHSQYDKGGGASLDDFWSNFSKNPLFAGGFIWAMVDESVARTDKGGELDSDGGNAPDGIVGPHREKEASWYTIRDVWAPLQIAPFTASRHRAPVINLTNKSLYTPLSDYTLNYEVICVNPLEDSTPIAAGNIPLPSAMPGESVNLTVGTKEEFRNGDILRLTALNADNDTVNVWSYPLLYADEYHAQTHATISSSIPASVTDSTLSANNVTARFNLSDGMLSRVTANGKEIPFNNGPLPIGMKMELTSITRHMQGDTAVMVMRYKGAVDSIVWRMTPDGVLGMDILMLNRKNGGGFKGAFFDNEIRNLGFSFSYPEELCKGMTWVGKGPYRVWRNRQRGTTFGLWHKDYNNTVTGQTTGKLQYPEFKGYHANTYWAQLHSDEAPLTVSSESDGIYLRVFTPEEPKARTQPGPTMTKFPEGDISFMLEIPPIRSYKPLEQLGPGGIAPNIRINKGDEGIRMKLWFDFTR